MIKTVAFAWVLCLLMDGASAGTAGQCELTSGASTRARRNELLVRIEGTKVQQDKFSKPARVAGYELTPLFPRLAVPLRESSEAIWVIATPEEKVLQSNPWDQAHDFVQRSNKDALSALVSNVSSVFAEPDSENTPCDDAAISAQPDKKWPWRPEIAWHLGDEYTQLGRARKTAVPSTCAPRVTILDTGFYPEHVTVPRQIQTDLQINFVEKNYDARDPGVDGPLKNPGHGTATMAILAGNRIKIPAEHPTFDADLGGAPDAAIVPVRIANSVLHFWTKEMAQGINYISTLPKADKFCDVVSISMGGIASRAWADAVNYAYDNGITVVAAAGNNYVNLPTRFTVYPSRFLRVITVTGATADYRPYRAPEAYPLEMQGNYGPSSIMKKAIGAYTPNIPWAKWKTRNAIDLDGRGTSAATPQVAAAAALWLQANGSHYARGWQRVEATKMALFQSADRSKPESETYFGNGLLRAADALAIHVPTQALRKQPLDEVSFPFWRILLGLGEPHDDEERMYEVEALNVAIQSRELNKYTGEVNSADMRPFKDIERNDIAERFVQDKRSSKALQIYVRTKMKVQNH